MLKSISVGGKGGASFLTQISDGGL
jgi:hypothetical protein